MPKSSVKQKDIYPILPLKDVVLFPRMVVPLLVGRPPSLSAVEECLASGRPLFACAQRDPEMETPGQVDLHQMGILVNILQTLRMPDGTVKIVVEGLGRAVLDQLVEGESFDEAQVHLVGEKAGTSDELEALKRIVLDMFEDYVRKGQRIAPEVVLSLKGVEDSSALSDLICAHLNLLADERQELLEIEDPKKRLEKLATILTRDLDFLDIEKQVRDKVRDQMEKGHREFYLNEQLKLIQDELSDTEYSGDDAQELRKLITKCKMPKDVLEKALRELSRFEKMQPLSPESSIVQTYLEWLTEMPWTKRSRDVLDLDKALKVLDEDHYGLGKVKERILEFLAVRKLSKGTKGPVLCLVGPPGVGKTSLGKSVARAMNRKFARVSLGGVRDEAEIRGHRRTYIGAMPGRIIQSMKKAGVVNPVFMLDEIDKMSTDFRGDPSSALLEVLDPEQNGQFSDHYLEVDYDLHEVFFITTANNEYEIPEPLLDRMEIVRMPGYTPLEKSQIATRFLIPKQVKESGLSMDDIHFSPKALDTILCHYTEEAGVRELERKIAAICRKVAREVVQGKSKGKNTITEKRVVDMLGPPEYTDVETLLQPVVGVSIGLAWTSTGGDTLIIESLLMSGKGELKLTGQLGDVMQESAQAVYTYLRANAKALDIPSEFWKSKDLHLHVPEGGIPKDGPSAGCAIAVSMLSALRKQVPKERLAMTGEITLMGNVLPIGGLKEKMLAAHRAKMKTVILPRRNEKDLVDIPKEISRDLEFVLVDTLDDVLAYCLPKRKRRKAAAKRKKSSK